jgi:hypothetical protein
MHTHQRWRTGLVGAALVEEDLFCEAAAAAAADKAADRIPCRLRWFCAFWSGSETAASKAC